MEEKEVLIPISVFSGRQMSCLESAVRYLKENRGMKFCEIGRALGRDQRTVWASYRNAVSKSGRSLQRLGQSSLVSSKIFLDRRKSFLECLVSHMRKEMGMRNMEISEALCRDQRTVSTVFHRSVKKQVRMRMP